MANAYRMNKLSYLAHADKNRRTRHVPKSKKSEQEVSEGSNNVGQKLVDIVNDAAERARKNAVKKGLNRISGKPNKNSAASFVKGAAEDINSSTTGAYKPLKNSKIQNANKNTMETRSRENKELKTRTSNGFKVYQVDIRNGQRYYVYAGSYSEYEKIPENVRRIVEMGNVKSAKYAITYDYQGHSTRIFRKP